MRKKKVFAVLTVLTALCMLVTGALVGCGGQHEHNYTKWAKDETQHWLVCPEDNAKDGNSVADHEFGTNGKCECGYEKPHTHAYTKWKSSETEHWKVCPDDNTEEAGSRAAHSYTDGECACGRQVGSVTGTVKLYKFGEYITDIAGVTAKLDDKALPLAGDGKFTVENLEVGKTYQLVVSNGGYIDYTENVEVEKGAVKQVGKDGIVALQYGVFSNNNLAYIDYSGANDGYVAFKGLGKTEDKLVTADKYLKVNAYAKFELSDAYKTTNEENSLYSVGLKFDDGKEVRIDAWFKKGSAIVKHPEWRTCFGPDDLEYGLELYKWSSYEEFSALVDDGFDYMLIRDNGKLKLVIEDYVKELDLPEAYADQPARVMLVAEDFGDNTGKKLNFAISETEKPESKITFTTNAADFAGAEAALEKTSYKFEETVKINVTVPADKVATVTIDGKPRILEQSGEVTFNAGFSHSINIVFSQSKFTGELTVDEKYNGKTITLKKEGQTDVALTVADGKVTLTNVKLGEWTATCEFFGIDLKANVVLISDMTELDLSGFTAGTADIDLGTGAFKWYRLSHKTVNVNLAEEASGDQFVALKINTSADFLDWANKYDEMNFGIAMTVNGVKHAVNFNWRNWQHDQIGFSSDALTGNIDSYDRYRGNNVLMTHLFKPKFTGFGNGWDFGTYGGAIIEGGLYFVLQYEATTGDAKLYLSDGETYMLVFTEEELFEKNGTLTAFGVVEGDADNGWSGGIYPGTADREFTFTLDYGTSMQAAVNGGVFEWKSVVNITGNKDSVEGANVVTDKTAYEYGETATITVTVPENKIATVTVGDGTPVVLEQSGNFTIENLNKLEYTVNVVFASDKYSGEVTVGTAYNGKTITLKKEGQTDVALTVADGKVTLTNVKLGEWTATCEFLGVTLNGKVILTDGMTELDMSGFNAGTADLNLTTGAFEYTSKKDNAPTVNLELSEAKTGDTYVGLKISTDISWNDWTVSNFEELHLGVWMTVGDSKHWVELHWRNWEIANFAISKDTAHEDANTSSEILKSILWKPIDGFSFGTHGWTAMPFGTEFCADGIYLIMKYESATGNVDVLLAKSDGYVKVCTFEKMFDANGEVKAFGVGAIGGDKDYNYHNTPGGFKIDCVLSIGSSLQDITGIELGEWTAPATVTPEEQ